MLIPSLPSTVHSIENRDIFCHFVAFVDFFHLEYIGYQ